MILCHYLYCISNPLFSTIACHQVMTAWVLGITFWLKFNSLADVLPAPAQSSEYEAQHAQAQIKRSSRYWVWSTFPVHINLELIQLMRRFKWPVLLQQRSSLVRVLLVKRTSQFSSSLHLHTKPTLQPPLILCLNWCPCLPLLYISHHSVALKMIESYRSE